MREIAAVGPPWAGETEGMTWRTFKENAEKLKPEMLKRDSRIRNEENAGTLKAGTLKWEHKT
jgi:hypothetical protein